MLSILVRDGMLSILLTYSQKDQKDISYYYSFKYTVFLAKACMALL